jgi:hypothetical protein
MLGVVGAGGENPPATRLGHPGYLIEQNWVFHQLAKTESVSIQKL